MKKCWRNYKDEVIKKLKAFKKEDIIIRGHAELQANCRQIDVEEVKKNIINPKRLVYAEKQEAEYPNEEKYNCYFWYSNTQCHRYVFAINKKVKVVTIIKINRRWQHIIEKRCKK